MCETHVTPAIDILWNGRQWGAQKGHGNRIKRHNQVARPQVALDLVNRTWARCTCCHIIISHFRPLIHGANSARPNPLPVLNGVTEASETGYRKTAVARLKRHISSGKLSRMPHDAVQAAVELKRSRLCIYILLKVAWDSCPTCRVSTSRVCEVPSLHWQHTAGLHCHESKARGCGCPVVGAPNKCYCHRTL